VRILPQGITNRQLFFILFLSLTTYSAIFHPSYMIEITGRSFWLPTIIVAVLYAFLTFLIAKTNYMFQGKTLFDYTQEVLGKFIACSLAYFLLIYALNINVFLNLYLINLVKSNFLPNTPIIALIITMVLLIAYVAYKGITVIARLYLIIGLLFLIVTLFLCLVMLIEGNLYNILPIFQISDIKEPFEIFRRSVFAFGGVEILFIIPFTKNNKNAPKTAFFTLIFIGLFYILIFESTVSILGINNTNIYNDAFIEAIKIEDIPVVNRPDIFYLTFGLMSLFAGLITTFTIALEFACRLFAKLSRLFLTIILGIIFTILSYILFNIKSIFDIYDIYMPYFIMITSILIPILVFVLIKVKKQKA